MTPLHTRASTGRRAFHMLDKLTSEETAMTVDTSHTTSPISRRVFLHTAAGATAGLAGILMTKTPPLYAATRTLTMLTFNHFVPASDENLRKWAKEFEKA